MPAPNIDPRDRVRWVVSVVAALVQYLVLGVAVYITPQYIKTELHTSAPSGRAWLNELLSGHPDRIYIAPSYRHPQSSSGWTERTRGGHICPRDRRPSHRLDCWCCGASEPRVKEEERGGRRVAS
ncbi:hypothetical protein B0H10DRAFT_2065846 [Mycena sp. CBHHK59/15]|nr:hypothetical protein B0H10DRAFT_2065846 [Mycena sp. CBHHK59/15]